MCDARMKGQSDCNCFAVVGLGDDFRGDAAGSFSDQENKEEVRGRLTGAGGPGHRCETGGLVVRHLLSGAGPGAQSQLWDLPATRPCSSSLCASVSSSVK